MPTMRGWVTMWARFLALLMVAVGFTVWHPLTASAAGLPGTFVPLTPARVLDTRVALGAPGPVAADSTIHVQIAGRGGVPTSGVSAVVMNVTETEAGSSGYITVYPDDATRPTASNLNFPKGDTRANLVTVRLGSNGKMAIASSSSRSVQLVADVSGYFVDGMPTAAGTFVSLDPTRVLDTRLGLGAPGPVAPDSTIDLQVAGQAGVPTTGVSAVVLNVTETAAATGGYVTVFPFGTGRPNASNLNYPAGDTRANLVTVMLSDGKVSLASSNKGTVHLVADVAGYYLEGTPSAAGAFVPTYPSRVLDTRLGWGAPGPVAPNSTIHVQFTGTTYVPSTGVAAVVANVTETDAGSGGYVTVYPGGTTRPTASNLNYPRGDTRANLAVVKLGSGGKLAFASSNSSTVQLISDVAGYYITGVAPVACSNPMSLVFNTSLDTTLHNHVELRLQGGGPVTIDWGGAGAASPAPTGVGTVQTYAPGPGTVGFTYTSAGTYTVRVCGSVSHFWAPNQTTLTTVSSFGGLGISDLTSAFEGATHLTSVPATLPSTATKLEYMFTGATRFNQDLSSWDTSHVTDMKGMFDNVSFNQPIGGWNTSNVTDMSQMFASDRSFNQDIGRWDTGRVTTMNDMFYSASAFNKNISGWNVSHVTDMGSMFSYAGAFNQPIGSWDTSSVSTMSGMFDHASAFNQPIGSWKTANVTTTSYMFGSASAFNQPIGGWDTSRVTTMNGMFYRGTAFNQPIGAWNTARVSDFSDMFSGASVFNQPIGGWDTSSATDMAGMFGNAWAFDQPLGGWNTSHVTTMRAMFYFAAAFDQPLGSWDTSQVTDMAWMFNYASVFNQDIGAWSTGRVTDVSGTFAYAKLFDQNLGRWNVTGITKMDTMFSHAALSTTNYDAILNGWAAQAVHPDLVLDAGTSTYSAAGATARDTLITGHGWVIVDGGLAP